MHKVIKSQKKAHLILIGWNKKGKTNPSIKGFTMGDKLDSRCGQQIFEKFLCSSDPSNSVSNHPILSQLSDKTKKSYDQYDKEA